MGNGELHNISLKYSRQTNIFKITKNIHIFCEIRSEVFNESKEVHVQSTVIYQSIHYFLVNFMFNILRFFFHCLLFFNFFPKKFISATICHKPVALEVVTDRCVTPLTGRDCKYRESLARLKKSKILIICLENPFREIHSKKLF